MAQAPIAAGAGLLAAHPEPVLLTACGTRGTRSTSDRSTQHKQSSSGKEIGSHPGPACTGDIYLAHRWDQLFLVGKRSLR